AENPATREPLEEYPVSTWQDCEEALSAAAGAFQQGRAISAEKLAAFLEAFAGRIEARKDEIVELASAETALPISPRLADNELPRTTGQLRQAAAAAREGSWAQPTIDTKNNIRSMLAAVGPVVVFGPNNFPLAFNSASGGDFAAAIATGNPVIAKANTSHPGTTRLLAEEAHAAAEAAGLPPGWVQLLYRTSHEDGERLVADHRIGATGYTGSRAAGLKLKAAADKAGKPIYLELSSVNPVVILPGALDEKGDDIAGQFATSCLMGTGQFCTNPGLVILLAGERTEQFIDQLVEKFKAAPVGTLLSAGVAKSLESGISFLIRAGAHTLVGGKHAAGKGYCHANTLLRASGRQFLEAPEAMQTEAFGNASLLVVAADLDEACRVGEQLEGNLTGCVYSHGGGADDAAYERLAPILRQKVGRLLNDKMPTGVAVSPAMNHGGPYPATGHPGFTAVGIPAALRRFAALACYDGVRDHRLPAALQNKNPSGQMWRLIDGKWTTGDV
ncbi:MAG TPA: aldehyde dehydrogenase (NADP(+)), partial [Pirellulaceae bacterium]|nr:aldehyde dehydrogenase (NADP(+)) [Pirellulaceae bacterium]